MKQSRREFLQCCTVLAMGPAVLPSVAASALSSGSRAAVPWYRRTLRWGQTNITEADPATYDIGWWREYWKRTRVQGVIINAAGIVAYYPSHFPLQYRAARLGERDLFGELVEAAHHERLSVLARMDSNRAHEAFYQAHPDWFAVDGAGKPYKAGELFIACVNSPYYSEYLPEVLREIAERYHPEGFTDNSWSGLGRDSICYCQYCQQKFQDHTGKPLPKAKDWDAPDYRAWLLWNYARRLELWDLNNGITRAAGGPDCIWAGMNSGSISGQCQSFRDYREICRRAELIMLDHQARGESGGFQQNAETGQLVHQMLGWEKLIPESMAMYQAGRVTFRKSAKPAAEARLWMLEGLAGGLQPWWHHVGAQQEDHRQFRTAEPVTRWHETNQQYLVDRQPVAAVGLVWSQRNTDFYGRDHPNELVELPWRGWANALVRARILWLPIHLDDLDGQAASMSILIIPNLAAISDAQAASLRRFVERGGALIATGRSGLYDEWGKPRSDFVLADLFGAHYRAEQKPQIDSDRKRATETLHTYLRLERAGQASVRDQAGAPAGHATPTDERQILRGFEETEILPFGGWLGDVVAAEGTGVPLTFIPPFPVYPPETSWMREPRTRIPGLILNRQAPGRVAFLPADVDRRYAMDALPDHGDLLANLVRWAAGDHFPLRVEGPGLIDCHLYRQAHRLILHLVNLTVTSGRGPVEESLPLGPLVVRLALPAGITGKSVRLLVSNKSASITVKRGWLTVTLPAVLDHEVLVIS